MRSSDLDHLAEAAGTVGRWAYFAHLRDAVRVLFPGKVPQILARLVARLEGECRPQSKAARIVTTPRLAALGMKLMKGAIAIDEEPSTLWPIVTG